MEDSRRRGLPTGYERMRLAVLPGCPEDVRLLARCELARRAADADLERRQPLLFEPELAIEFNLLPCQERLKALYVESRKTGRAG